MCRKNQVAPVNMQISCCSSYFAAAGCDQSFAGWKQIFVFVENQQNMTDVLKMMRHSGQCGDELTSMVVTMQVLFCRPKNSSCMGLQTAVFTQPLFSFQQPIWTESSTVRLHFRTFQTHTWVVLMILNDETAKQESMNYLQLLTGRLILFEGQRSIIQRPA